MLLNAQRLWWGAWDWRHDAWQGRFYPEDLPADWQLPYYANAFRCVGVPLEAWRTDVLALREAAPPEFAFVVEAPPGLHREGPERAAVRALAETLDGHLGALLIPARGEDADTLQAALAWAGEFAPALADGPSAPADMPRVWRPDLPAGEAGAVLVARVPVANTSDLPSLRHMIEAVLQAAGARPALMLLEEESTAHAAEQAGAPAATQRLAELGILAGLLGVA